MKVGIVCDDHKLEKFKVELKKKGFENLKITPGPTRGVTTITVKTDEDGKNKINVVCQEVELWFKNRN